MDRINSWEKERNYIKNGKKKTADSNDDGWVRCTGDSERKTNLAEVRLKNVMVNYNWKLYWFVTIEKIQPRLSAFFLPRIYKNIYAGLKKKIY